MLKSPVEYAKDIEPGRHIVLFYENAEYSRSICFAFLKAGMEKDEHSYYVTAKEDKDFFKNEFIEKMYGPNVIYEYNTTPNIKFNERLFHGQNIPNLSDKHSNKIDEVSREIVSIVNNVNQDKQNNILSKNSLSNNNNNNNNNNSRLILRCIHRVETQDQLQNNFRWESNFRNTKLRKDLPNTSLICTYPVDNIIETLKGRSKSYSPWMTALLEIYDGVIYARNNWIGAAFNFV